MKEESLRNVVLELLIVEHLVEDTVSQELHQPKPFGTQDFISRVLLIHTYT